MRVGRLSSNDIRLFLSFLPVLQAEAAEAKVLVKEKREKLFGRSLAKVCWCNFYELPFLEHLARCVAALGIVDDVKEIAAAPNQIEAVAAMLAGMDAEIDAAFESASQEELEQIKEGIPFLLALVNSVHNSLRCLLAFGCYLNDLVARARAGDEASLFNAIRVDPTVIGCPTAVAYLSRAVLIDDKRFMTKLKAALSGKLQKREQANFQKMRIVLQVLFEAGAEQLTDEQLHELFIKELRLYSADSRAGDVTKNLRKFANQYMKARATT